MRVCEGPDRRGVPPALPAPGGGRASRGRARGLRPARSASPTGTPDRGNGGDEERLGNLLELQAPRRSKPRHPCSHRCRQCTAHSRRRAAEASERQGRRWVHPQTRARHADRAMRSGSATADSSPRLGRAGPAQAQAPARVTEGRRGVDRLRDAVLRWSGESAVPPHLPRHLPRSLTSPFPDGSNRLPRFVG
jgi:hypothetical protein